MARTRNPLEGLSDRQRICLLLHADGRSYAEIGQFLDLHPRRVRNELETIARSALPGILDHQQPVNRGRLQRAAYLAGVLDAGGDPDELTDYLDALVARARWLRSRMTTEKAVEHGEDTAGVA